MCNQQFPLGDTSPATGMVKRKESLPLIDSQRDQLIEKVPLRQFIVKMDHQQVEKKQLNRPRMSRSRIYSFLAVLLVDSPFNSLRASNSRSN